MTGLGRRMAEDYTLTIDDNRLAAQVQPKLFRAAAAITRKIAAQARQDVPVRTGNLGRSIEEDALVADGPLKVKTGVTAKANYAVFVHEGTAPHTIRARNARALAFTVDGRRVFAKSVRHPGTRPNPFLRQAAEIVIASL